MNNMATRQSLPVAWLDILDNQFASKKEVKMYMTTSIANQSEPDQSTMENLESIEEEIEASSMYFKPKPDKIYTIKMHPTKDKIVPVENDRFKDINGNPIKRFECKITHINNGREQIWQVGKTVCLQIIEQLKIGFTVLKVVRHGSDRNTTYTIEGVP